MDGQHIKALHLDYGQNLDIINHGGAIGFRDQLQDTLGIKFLDINFMKKQILIGAKHQFIEGDVEHWWHEETRKRYKNQILR